MSHKMPQALTDPSQFDIACLEDEIRADQLTGELLKLFCSSLIDQNDEDPLTAGSLARGADHFLREFIIGDRRENLLKIAPERVRQFAGNWYIVKTLEPNMAELGDILEGVEAFYGWLARNRLFDRKQAEAIAHHCGQLDFYRERIEQFWAIEGDGYLAWNQACPLPGQ
ncbi:MAG: hypothetical protein Tsb0017_11120 [Geothermobacteraceae bacterium]